MSGEHLKSARNHASNKCITCILRREQLYSAHGDRFNKQILGFVGMLHKHNDDIFCFKKPAYVGR